jgi:hypothetical protein
VSAPVVIAGGEQVAKTDETTRLACLTPSEVSDRCGEAYAVRVLDALADTGTAIRAHDGMHLLGATALPTHGEPTS